MSWIKNKIFYKKYKNFSQKTILYVLPILNGRDEAWVQSWIYFAFIFSNLEVWRAVIFFLKTILWGLLFGKFLSCVAMYWKMPRLKEIVMQLFLNEETCANIIYMYNENWWNNKTEKEWHLFVCVFIIAVNNVFWNSLHLLVMLILTGFYNCYACYPWWASQILLKFGWNEPFCNRNKPLQFQLSIISDLEFICHWILCNFPILGWSWANNKFMPNLSDSYTHWNSAQPKTLYSRSFPPKLSIFGISFGRFWRVSGLQVLKIGINLILQKIVINFATDSFSKVTLYSVTIAIKLPQKYQYVHSNANGCFF